MMNVKLFTKTVDSKVGESNPHLLEINKFELHKEDNSLRRRVRDDPGLGQKS